MLNVITLGLGGTDNVNQMKTINNKQIFLNSLKTTVMFYMGPLESDYNKQLLTLTIIILRTFTLHNLMYSLFTTFSFM